jgi:hypothetical protein
MMPLYFHTLASYFDASSPPMALRRKIAGRGNVFIDDATTRIHTGSTNGSDLLLVEMMRESAQKVCIARRA